MMRLAAGRALAVAAACLAVSAAAVASLAGCTPAAGAVPSGSSSLTSGIREPPRTGSEWKSGQSCAIVPLMRMCPRYLWTRREKWLAMSGGL